MEAFADRWIMFIGLTIFTTALLGVALSMNSMPAPDATGAANTIDEVAASPGGTHMEYEHSAAEVQVRNKSFGLRNEGGTARESVSFGGLVPVTVGDTHYDGLDKVVQGEQWQDVFASKSAFFDRAKTAKRSATGNTEWVPASGTLRVTTEVIEIDGDEKRLIIVAF